MKDYHDLHCLKIIPDLDMDIYFEKVQEVDFLIFLIDLAKLIISI